MYLRYRNARVIITGDILLFILDIDEKVEMHFVYLIKVILIDVWNFTYHLWYFELEYKIFGSFSIIVKLSNEKNVW